MMLNKIQSLSCGIYFGIAGLHNPCLIENFYPPDLPEDWYLGYYSNEFRLILIKPSDLEISSDIEENASAVLARIEHQIMLYREEVSDADFIFLLDVSELQRLSKAFLLENDQTSIIRELDTLKDLFFLDLKRTTESTILPGHKRERLRGKSVIRRMGEDFVFYIDDQEIMKPAHLKKLIEQIRDFAIKEELAAGYVIFSSEHFALENCRNAIALESMM